jgi:hypothetical protein
MHREQMFIDILENAYKGMPYSLKMQAQEMVLYNEAQSDTIQDVNLCVGRYLSIDDMQGTGDCLGANILLYFTW